MNRRKALLLSLAVALVTATGVGAVEENRAAVVVRYDDERSEVHCVEFSEPSISGETLLERAGLTPVVSTGALGQAVCAIEEVGCAADDCFCDCRGASCTYWSYWHREDDEWRYATVGASVYDVTDGDVDGWSWGPGSISEAIAPPDVDLATACAEIPVAASPEVAPTAGASAGSTGYVVFAGLVVALGGLLMWQKRRAS